MRCLKLGVLWCVVSNWLLLLMFLCCCNFLCYHKLAGACIGAVCIGNSTVATWVIGQEVGQCKAITVLCLISAVSKLIADPAGTYGKLKKPAHIDNILEVVRFHIHSFRKMKAVYGPASNISQLKLRSMSPPLLLLKSWHCLYNKGRTIILWIRTCTGTKKSSQLSVDDHISCTCWNLWNPGLMKW